MRVLVTGGTGFIGRWVVKSLEERGADIVVCTRTAPERARYSIVLADLLKPDAAERAILEAKPDIVLHNAWCVDHGKFWSAPANLDWTAATLRLARAAKDRGVRRFVGVGTCFEYSWPADADCVEQSTPIRPTSLYGVTKDATRRIVEEYAAGTGLEFAWARLFYLFGPYEHPDRLASSVAIKLARNQAAPLSSGLAVRDFIDVRDAGAAISALALSRVTAAVNIGSGNGVTIADLAGMLKSAAGGSGHLQLGALPDRAGEPPRIVADVRRLRREVGYQPAISMEERLGETYRWWQQHLAKAKGA